jgi:superfamily II DNA helicase RecQ
MENVYARSATKTPYQRLFYFGHINENRTKSRFGGCEGILRCNRQLLCDLSNTMEKLQYRAIEFSESEYLSSGIRMVTTSDVKFVLMVVETAMQLVAQQFLRAVCSRGLVNAFVIEECHNVSIQATFRPMFTQLKYLSAFDVRFIFVSGTCPLPFQNNLRRDFRVFNQLFVISIYLPLTKEPALQ